MYYSGYNSCLAADCTVILSVRNQANGCNVRLNQALYVQVNVCMYIRTYVWPRYSTSGWLYIIVSLLFASSARTAMASVYQYVCTQLLLLVLLCTQCTSVMWIALRPQCMLGGSQWSLQGCVCSKRVYRGGTCVQYMHHCV